MFLTSFNVYFVFGYAWFMCGLYVLKWLSIFLGQDLAFLVKTGWLMSGCKYWSVCKLIVKYS